MNPYDFKTIEAKWKDIWEKTAPYKTVDDSKKEKHYVLDMFPYPSGEGLHMGHTRIYTASDIYTRSKRMQGYNVLHPTGWDAFGLPAEETAIKQKLHPRILTDKNINTFREQMKMLSLSYDFDREVDTTDPNFYKWTQWIFLKLYEKGLAFETFSPINWCPSCQTGLANEDLDGGKCERCGSVVEKKPMRQWTLKITDYADRLIDDLNTLPNWPLWLKELERNWIGRSEGAEFDFKLAGVPDHEDGSMSVKVFTTRADTLFGATYVAISAETAKTWVDSGWKVSNEINEYISKTLEEQKVVENDYSHEPEKTGVFTGVYAINPANNEKLPVWIANYVLGGVGTGAIMAVPAHDERDFDFAKKYNIKIKEVVRPYVIDHVNVPRADKPTKVRKNVHAIVYDPANKKYLILRNSIHNWDTVVIGGIEEGEDEVETAKRELKEETGYVDVEFKRILGNPVQAGYFAPHKDENRLAIATAVYFELKSNKQEMVDTGGENEGNEILWVSESDFVPGKMINSELSFWLERLKSDTELAYVDEGVLVNSEKYSDMNSKEARDKMIVDLGGKKVKRYKLQDWVFSRQRYWGEPIPMVHDENKKPWPLDVTELPLILPQVEHYEPSGTGESPLANMTEWVNVKGYITDAGTFKAIKGGETAPDGKEIKSFTRETNTMPQWAGSSWYYLRFADPKNDKALISPELEKYWQPVDVYVGGAEHATRHLIYARFWHKFLYDIGVVTSIEPFTRMESVGLVLGTGGIKMSKRLGNIINPDDVVGRWGTDVVRTYVAFMGSFYDATAFDEKQITGVDRFLDRVWKAQTYVGENSSKDLIKIIHQTIKKVTEDIAVFKFNTAVSQLMICLNAIEKEKTIGKTEWKQFIQLLAPYAPSITEELWSLSGESNSIHISDWPKYDEALVLEEKVTISLQINGKLRGTFVVPFGSDENGVIQVAKQTEGYKKYVGSNEPKKVIVVQNRIINIVI